MWSGPVSASVLVHEIELDSTSLYIQYLRKCDQRVKDQVTFHYLFPYEISPSLNKRIGRKGEDDMPTTLYRKKLLDIIASEDLCSDTTRLLKRIKQR